MSAGVRPFARASRNPDNPEFAAEDLLEKVTGGTATAASNAPDASSDAVKVVKHSRLSVYLTPEEHWHVRDNAHARRMSLNDYVRSLLLAGMK